MASSSSVAKTSRKASTLGWTRRRWFRISRSTFLSNSTPASHIGPLSGLVGMVHLAVLQAGSAGQLHAQHAHIPTPRSWRDEGTCATPDELDGHKVLRALVPHELHAALLPVAAQLAHLVMAPFRKECRPQERSVKPFEAR